MAPVVRVLRGVLEQLQQAASESPSEECCGLLAGPGATITRVLPAANVLASATAYEIAPEELFRLMREIRASGLIMLGIYHSHPRGNNVLVPPTFRAYYPDAAYFILSPLPMPPTPFVPSASSPLKPQNSKSSLSIPSPCWKRAPQILQIP